MLFVDKASRYALFESAVVGKTRLVMFFCKSVIVGKAPSFASFTIVYL